MNYIDFIIIILIIISAISGAFKGFIHEISGLIGLIAGIWSAVKFSGALETYLVNRWNITSEFIGIISFVIIFVLILILIGLAAKAIEKAIETAHLSALNRIFGFIFSIFKTMFFLGVLIILIESLHQSLPFIPINSIQESKYSQPLKVVTIKTFPFLKELFENSRSDEEQKDERNKQDKEQSPEPDPTDSIEIVS